MRWRAFHPSYPYPVSSVTMNTRLPLPTLAVLLSALATPTALLAQAKVESVVVSPQGATIVNPSFTVASKTGLHVLLTAPKGSRQVYLHDGVEGPRFDRAGNGKAISIDGKRHAYTAHVGTEEILVLDGKEIVRTTPQHGGTAFPAFGFSPSGKRFWYVSPLEAGGVHKLVVDGVASDPTHGITLHPIFSPDESRYVAMFSKQDERRGSLLMVDGKSMGFVGDKPQFSPDGKNVLTIAHGGDVDTLMINGKPASRAPILHSAHMSTGGLNFLVVSGSRSTPGVFLGAGGKKIEGSDCQSIDKVLFSPDGKRYAALCTVGGSKKFVLIDGKKGQVYDQVEELQFTADSAKCLYLGRSHSAGGQFLVVEDDESDGSPAIQLSLGGGKRIGYIARITGGFDSKVVVDGKATPAVRGASYLGFSPDGSRFAFQAGNPPYPGLYLDGVEQKGVAVVQTNAVRSQTDPWFTFSADNKYIAHFGFANGEMGKQGLVVNGKLVDATTSTYCLPFFTPDSKHIVYFRFVPGGGYEVMVDGKAVEKVSSFPTGLGQQGPAAIPPFEMGADGVFTFIAIVDGAAKRFRITPDGSTSLAAFLAEAEAAQAKAKAAVATPAPAPTKKKR
ncbi:MAG: hypothetical protein JNK23_15890 [Opitutaceae bacterium]|nr:hypothetical protein [Opitutaceae bacterium]